MRTERVEVVKNHGDNDTFVDITVTHKQTGSSYSMPLSREAYEQLRDYFEKLNLSNPTPLNQKP